jgi:hypothetical protein
MADQFMSGAQGALGGAGTGAAMGTALLPGVGTVVGALLGGTIGAFSGASKAKDQNNALGMLNAIPNVDPNQTIFKDQLYREKRAVDSGFTTDFQVARDIIGQQEAGGMSVAAEMARTNPALALMSMDQIGKGADTSVNKALGTIGTKSMGYTSMIGELIDKMSQRKIQVDLLKAQSALAISTKGMQDFNANSNAGMMKLLDPSVMGGFKTFGSMFAKAPGGIPDMSMTGGMELN